MITEKTTKTAKKKFRFRTALVRPRLTRKHPSACGRHSLIWPSVNGTEEIMGNSPVSKPMLGGICGVRGRASREKLLHASA
jgi:hypothetical protein